MNFTPYSVRFQGAPWYDPSYDIIVGGAGGIGSTLVMLLARMEYPLYIYDFDTIEAHNVGSGQMYMTSQLGMKKNVALKENATAFSGNSNIHIFEKYDEDSMTGNIVFAGFDNMKARKLMFDAWVEHQMSKTDEYRREHPEEVNLFVDGRLLSEVGCVYFINSLDDIKRYREELFEDDISLEAPCSFKATSHCAAFIAGLMVTGLTNQITNKKQGGNPREVPFRIEFELPLFNITCFD